LRREDGTKKVKVRPWPDGHCGNTRRAPIRLRVQRGASERLREFTAEDAEGRRERGNEEGAKEK